MKISLKLTAIGAAGALSACGLAPPEMTVDERVRLQNIHEQMCPDDQSVIEAVPNDNSDSVAASVWTDRRRPAIQSEIEMVAVCGGTIRIWDFAGSSGATNLLYEGELRPSGDTLNSRLNKVPDLVETAMRAVDDAHAAGSAQMSRQGTNVAAQFSAAADFLRATDGDLKRAVILTDGWTRLATAATPPSLKGTTVIISGVGIFDATVRTPTEPEISAAKARLDAFCGSTGATCVPATSDYTLTK